MGMADTNKRINLAAPLISVRRHGGAGGEATALPYYKPGDTSGPLGHTGTVPFRWEHRPGHPKSVRTRRPPPPPPPATVDREAKSPSQRPTAIAAAARTEEQQRFSDARSRDDVSCVTVNCSATGLSDAASACAAATGSRGGAMMERFLPAAHAVAVASPLSNFRKAGLSVREPARASERAFDGDRFPMQRRLPLAQHIPTNHLKILSPQDEYSDAESDVNSTQSFASSKRCGLLPTRCVKSTLLLLNPASAMRRSRGARRGEGNGGKSQGEMNPLLRRSRSAQQQPPRHTGGHDPDTQSWEELYIKSLLRSARSGLTSPAAAVDRTVRELYKQRGGKAVHPKASHLGLLLVLDRSNEPCRGSSKPNPGEASLLLPRTKSSPPHAGNKPNAGGYGFPLLLEDKPASQSPGREIVLSPQQAMLPALPSPKSPSESWLSRALPSVSNRPPPATTFLGLHVHSRKHAPLLPCSSIDSTKAVVQHARQRQIVRFHDLHK